MAFLDIEELTKQAEAQGVPVNLVNEYYRGNANNPDVQGIPPAKIVQGIAMAAGAATTGKIELPQVTVTGARPRLTTTVNPYAGTTQETGNPDAPNAAAISQFDPKALQAAQAAFNKQYADTQGNRTLGNILAGLGSGHSGGRTMDFNEKIKEEQLKHMYDTTLGAQGRLQAQATAGESALTSAQAREEAAGKFTGTQREMQQKLDLTQFSVDAQKRINDPNSNESRLAKQMYIDQIRVGGRAPTADEVKALSNATAAEIMGFMDPKVMAAFKERSNIGLQGAQGEQARGIAARDRAEGRRIDAATPGVAATSAITEAAAGSVIGPDGKLQPLPGSNISLQAGPASITPSPLTTGQQASGAEASARDQKQATVATNTKMPELSSDLLKVATIGDSSPTGLASPWMSRLTPGQMEQARARLEQIVSAKMQYDEAAGMNTIKDRDAEVMRMSILSRGAFQSEMARLNEQLTRQGEMLKSRNEYQQKNGTSAGFDPSSVVGKTYMVNPKTGQALFDNLTPEQMKSARAAGYMTTDDINQKAVRK